MTSYIIIVLPLLLIVIVGVVIGFEPNNNNNGNNTSKSKSLLLSFAHPWIAEVKHDKAGGIFRVSGDGPKFNYVADPMTDIGEGQGSLLIAEQIQSHPNYRYLSPLSECGQSRMTKKNTVVEDEFGVFDDDDEGIRAKRIVGGKSISDNKKHPWMVQIYLTHASTGEHFFHCAGTIITNSTILTASHCLTRIPQGASLDVLVVGSSERKNISFCKTSDVKENCSREYVKAIDSIEIHRDYSEGNLHHDIGLIYLKKPLKFSDSIQPVCLPQTVEILESWTNRKLLAVGWGSTHKYLEGYNSVMIKEVELDLQPRLLCDQFHVRIYGKTGIGRICVGGNADKSTCNGDSGGGILKLLPSGSSQKKQMFQLGIVSAGGHAIDTCGFQGRPTLVTNVLFYISWILNHIVKGATAYKFSATSTVWTKKAKTDNNAFAQDTFEHYKNEFSTGKGVDVSKHPNVNLLPSLEDCGNQLTSSQSLNTTLKRRKRLLGGSATSLEGYLPWMAQIYVRNVEDNRLVLRCSGTIISKRVILTGAHCVTEIGFPFVLENIVVGQYNRNVTVECLQGSCYTPKVLKNFDIIVHPEYEKFTHRSNVALVRLSEDLQFTVMIQPICLPRKEALTEGIKIHRYFSAGWGKLAKDVIIEHTPPAAGPDKMSNILLVIDVTLKHRAQCDFLYSRTIDLLGRSRLCGGGEAAKGECNGDGGSPLMKKIDIGKEHLIQNKIFQLGLVAFTDCGQEGMPTVYVNVIYFMEWILDNLSRVGVVEGGM